jgi:hypothetical protein
VSALPALSYRPTDVALGSVPNVSNFDALRTWIDCLRRSGVEK